MHSDVTATRTSNRDTSVERGCGWVWAQKRCFQAQEPLLMLLGHLTPSNSLPLNSMQTSRQGCQYHKNTLKGRWWWLRGLSQLPSHIRRRRGQVSCVIVVRHRLGQFRRDAFYWLRPLRLSSAFNRPSQHDLFCHLRDTGPEG